MFKLQITIPKLAFLSILILCLMFINSLTFSQEEVKMKKVVMIIASDGFRDEELLEPKEILEDSGIEVKIASTSLSMAKGMLGAKVKPDMLLKDVKVEDFLAIIFVGGIGASQYWDDPLAHQIAQEAISKNRILAAICIAPVTLAKAGVLKGKRATVWSSEASQLKSAGANYTARPVEKDGNIITASGPFAAREFAEEILKALE